MAAPRLPLWIRAVRKLARLLKVDQHLEALVRATVPGVADLAALRQETDALYRFLYDLVHDLERPLPFSSRQTREAFATQWKTYKQGHYLLSDPWFRANVGRILCEEELLLKPEWFRGKHVLDAGCGNGRWSYGLGTLGCAVTSVDVNEAAIAETRNAVKDLPGPKEFHVSPLERVAETLHDRKFDLVFCWGVLHHCENFVEGLRQLTRLVRDDGILYLYLYGRESLPYAADVELFKDRVLYNTLPTTEARYQFLLGKANGNEAEVHGLHDIYAPLINRRLEFGPLKQQLEALGFADVTRTIDHTEVFVRALKAPRAHYERWLLPAKQPPYWFQHHDQPATTARAA